MDTTANAATGHGTDRSVLDDDRGRFGLFNDGGGIVTGFAAGVGVFVRVGRS